MAVSEYLNLGVDEDWADSQSREEIIALLSDDVCNLSKAENIWVVVSTRRRPFVT